jgi:multidrug efflux pump subunit AcrA (membrane-fusion protein)
MRYARIEGTEVMVQVHSAAEAKAAIKELKHKKKELQLIRKRMLREQRSARSELDKVERAHSRNSRRGGLTGLVSRISRSVKSREPLGDLATIEADLSRAEEILHNIDSCIIQLEGRLLS